MYEREEPAPQERAADISFPPALRSPSHLDDSSWIYQPPGQSINDTSHVSDGASGDTSGLRAMPSPAYPATPLSQQFREYSASDPGAQDYEEWRSVSESRERAGSWHECMSDVNISHLNMTLSLANLTEPIIQALKQGLLPRLRIYHLRLSLTMLQQMTRQLALRLDHSLLF